MNTVTNTTLKGFQQALNLVPHGQFKTVKDEIIKFCGFENRGTYRNKRLGIIDCSIPEANELRRIFKKYGIDVDTATYIKETA